MAVCLKLFDIENLRFAFDTQGDCQLAPLPDFDMQRFPKTVRRYLGSGATVPG